MADLMKSLNPNFHVCPPTDVRFWFKEQDGIIKEVKAHKVILASASEVFNKQFFGSLEAEDNIEIIDASQEVFHAMVELIYNKKANFKDADLRFLSSLYYLSDKYDIQYIMAEILVFISKLEVTKDNILDTAIVAEDEIIYPPLSEALYEAAARFMNKADGYGKKFKEVMDLCAGDSEAHALVIVKLLKRMKDYDCKNCKWSPCLNGLRLTTENFVPGASHTMSHSNGTVVSITLVQLEGKGYFSCKEGPHNYRCKLSTNYLFKCDAE